MEFQPFIDYCKKHIRGDEKSEAQTFLERFFIALGFPDGHKQTGGSFEERIKGKDSISFADFVWKNRVLIEMKKKNEDLSLHLQQATSYWIKLAKDRPRYIILCNFDEFWVYDFDKDIYEPQEKITLDELDNSKEALSFLLPVEKEPFFRIDKEKEDVTEKVAKYISEVYKSLTSRNRKLQIDNHIAIHYCLQCVLCLFAEDIYLLPDKIFSRIIRECFEKPGSGYDNVPETYDLIGGLFHEMNRDGITPSGRYSGVDYFNGGLFQKVYPIELTKKEIEYLDVACGRSWKHINPAIFGTIFEQSLDPKIRHEFGSHYTHEIDIKKIVDPVIVQPWKRKIDAVLENHTAKTRQITLDNLYDLHKQLFQFRVLDPACGSGNFLFIAYKEMKLLEREILKHIETFSIEPHSERKFKEYKIKNNLVSTKQFYGIDISAFAIDIARVTLMIAKELSIKETMGNDEALPLDNLDNNIVCADALFTEWPKVDAIIGNPPYQSKTKMQQEFGKEYINRLREAYPEVPGRADFCVYWFYKAHKHLNDNSFAGLIGTKTIRENYSREGSLDYIVKNKGVIINAVSNEKWSGEAAVNVSIVCWVKGKYSYDKELYIPLKNGDLIRHVVKNINTNLTLQTDVSSAQQLESNKKPKKVFQGQTHGHKSFLLSNAVGRKLLKSNPDYKDVLKPYLIGDDILSNINSQPSRFVIDFANKTIIKSSTYKEVFKVIEKNVLPDRKLKSDKQEKGNADILNKNPAANVNKHHINFFKNWWKLSYCREDFLIERDKLSRYIACSRITLRPIFEFFSKEINPNDKVVAFCFEDYYSFGIIQSSVHWDWFTNKGTTLGTGYNYNNDSVWDTFPWPQEITENKIRKVGTAAMALHKGRTAILKKYNLSLRELYRILEKPGPNPIKDLHSTLDEAVIEAYGFNEKEDILSQLLALNLKTAAKEKRGEKVQAPGLPEKVKNKERYITDDCVKFE